MQTTTNATLFQTSYSEALGAYRSRKAVRTSGLVPCSSTTLDARARYGYPIHLHPRFASTVLTNPEDLAVEGSGADGGRYRVLSMQVRFGWIWTSEAGGVVRQLDPETGATVALYRGAKAPVPAFDFIALNGKELLVTGSWDRALRVYRIADRSDVDKVVMCDPVLTVPDAMSDFIKCVHILASAAQTYIATAGSDKSIMLWDASLLATTIPQTLRCVHQAKPHTRPINALASLDGLDGSTRVYSADSMGRILEHTLNISTRRLEVLREITGFGTAVYDLRAGWAREEVDGDAARSGDDAFVSAVEVDDDGARVRRVAELWAASGDKSAAGYRLSPLLQPPASTTSARSTSSQPALGTQPALAQPFIRIPHDDFVKTVLPLHLYLPNDTAVVTGGSDEHLRLFPHPSADPSEVHAVEAHWHEVSALALYVRSPTTFIADEGSSATALPSPSAAAREAWIVSASLDGSIRRFRLDCIPKLPKPELVRPSVGQHGAKEQQWDQYSLPPPSLSKNAGQDTVVGGGRVQMTAEEEAELAELMGSDDDE